jgi:response regulator RpfG family c-di-GMP phosphodiesterase
MYLHYQNNALSEVTEGNFDAYVPVSSSDEFGIMAKYTNIMIESLKERTELLQQTQDVAILSLASLAETRDNETGAHIMRTQRYVYVLANYLKNDSDYEEALTEENIQLIYKSAPLHDIGKVGIPDNILLKPGRLTDEEFKIMKRHPNYGRKALNSAGKILGKNSFLKFAEEIAFTHHEKWDGSGYPRSLKGAEIPVSGRLMAVADVYDALISKRVYKDAFSHEKAKAIILESSGTHFDPKVVDAFINCESDFVKIAEDFSDEKYIDKVNKRKG